MKNINEKINILTKQLEDNEFKRLDNEIAKLNQMYQDFLTKLQDDSEFKRLDNETTKLNQMIQENNNEVLELKKITYENVFDKEKHEISMDISQNLWKDTQIIKLDQMELRLLSNEEYCSRPIYTSEGYLYRMKIYGFDRKENFMSIYFRLMQTEYDAALKWPFHKKVNCILRNNDKVYSQTISLENHLKFNSIQNQYRHTTRSFEKPTQKYNVAVGFDCFIDHEERNHYIINDTLFITVSIE
ncbi:TNF receptor-associated factor 5-like [Hydra vulgaris]|uniref:TNF receptor-associated factor 5-like n=1 Tax=Hydra vulgaris TaxID=6087 RepID=A0ABM4B8L6_HYDVU